MTGCGECGDWGVSKNGNYFGRFVIPVLPSLGCRFVDPVFPSLGLGASGMSVFVNPGCLSGDHLGGVRDVEKGSLSWQAGLSLFVSKLGHICGPQESLYNGFPSCKCLLL